MYRSLRLESLPRANIGFQLLLTRFHRSCVMLLGDPHALMTEKNCLCGVQEKFVALQRYTKQLDGEEDRLAALQKEMADLKAKRNQLQSELDAVVMKLTIDETL